MKKKEIITNRESAEFSVMVAIEVSNLVLKLGKRAAALGIDTRPLDVKILIKKFLK